MSQHSPATVFVVGAGNIGLQAVRLLTGITRIAGVVIIDFDAYESGNLGFQAIAPCQVGLPKALIAARTLREMRPDLNVTAHVGRFEDFPLGLLRGGVLLSCVDSRQARQVINAATVALGVPWLDAALSREGVVRARTYLPGHACLECAWSEEDYRLLAIRLPCMGNAAAPTAAPLELGALAAGLQIAALRRLLEGDAEMEVDQQVVFEVRAASALRARYTLNEACLLDHAPWKVELLQAGSVDWSPDQLLNWAGAQTGRVSLPFMNFVRRLRCSCGTRNLRLRLAGRMPHLCRRCGEDFMVTGVDREFELGATNTSPALMRQPLWRRGCVPGDIVAVQDAGIAQHFQLS